eukprot:5258709-Alexandrium_andersonii.AAC.1
MGKGCSGLLPWARPWVRTQHTRSQWGVDARGGTVAAAVSPWPKLGRAPTPSWTRLRSMPSPLATSALPPLPRGLLTSSRC